MSVYMTESEQVEMIKKLWKKYGTIITVGFALLLLCIAGFRYWNWHKDKYIKQASSTYERMMFAFAEQDAKAVKAYAKTLNTDFKDTIYSDIAKLTLAKLYIFNKDFSQAKQQLDSVILNTKSETIKDVARIRLVRLLIYEKNYTLALEMLDSISNKVYLPLILEFKGDVYKALGQIQNAQQSYKKAINYNKTQGISNVFLEMKFNDM